MAGIGVDLVNEFGESVNRLESNISSDISEFADENSPCIRFIDPYGDTIFNYLQVKVLRQELSTFHLRAPHLKKQIQDLIYFIDNNKNMTHLYLKFIGD